MSDDILRIVVDNTSDAIYVKDLDGRYLMVNAACARLFGKTVDAIVGMRDADLVSPAVARAIEERDRAVLASGKAQTFEETHEIGMTTYTFSTRKCPYQAPDGTVLGVIGISSDITELKRVQDALRQAQKMEAIGRLAAGVSHDFNNLLMVINGTADWLRKETPDDDPRASALDDILEAGGRGACLTRQLLMFSRKQVIETGVVDIDVVLHRLVQLVRRIIGEHIDVVLRANAPRGRVKVDAAQLEQAVLNLALNARDAMPGGGHVRIHTRNVDVRADGSALPVGRYVCISVTDEGAGMDEATRRRVFEPFFTTKEPGKGTGLGLAMVYGFVKQSGGEIELFSEVGRGTRFDLFFPRVEGEADGITAPAAPPEPLARTAAAKAATVLLVEDDDAVRMLLKRALESYGYVVLDARDGSDALRLWRAHRATIDVLVTDVVMPRVNGLELADEVRVDAPELGIIFMSGYPDEMAALGPSFLQKPFGAVDLARRVRAVLDRASSNDG